MPSKHASNEDSFHEANFEQISERDFLKLKQADLVKILQREAEKLHQLQTLMSGGKAAVFDYKASIPHQNSKAAQMIPAIEIDLSQNKGECSKLASMSLAQST